MRLAIILVAAMGLVGCATINGVPQTPCQRANRAAIIAHDAVRLANDAGADISVITRLNQAADAADTVAAGVCAATSPAPAGI